jgi:hypothetical protein
VHDERGKVERRDRAQQEAFRPQHVIHDLQG